MNKFIQIKIIPIQLWDFTFLVESRKDYLQGKSERTRKVMLKGRIQKNLKNFKAGLTGLEPATSTVTGWCSNRLNYNPN